MEHSHLPSLLHRMRMVTSFALLGTVLFGAFLSWIPVPFDIHVPGAIMGTIVGVVVDYRSRKAAGQ